jgi:hypothetical protein
VLAGCAVVLRIFTILGLVLGSLSLGADVIVYPWPDTAPRSERYSVRLVQDGVTWFPLELYSEPQLEQGPDGDGVTGLHEDRSMTYVPFAFTGPVTVEARKLFGGSAVRVEVTPRSFGIEPDYFDGRTVRFTLPDGLSPAYVSINFVTSEAPDADNVDANNNGAVAVRHGLVLFGDRPEASPPDTTRPGAVNYVSASRAEIENAGFLYFPAGDHHLGEKFGRIDDEPGTDARIYLQKDGQEIYLAPGAIVRGSIDANGHDGIRLHGRGLITGEDFYWHYFQDPGSAKGKVAFLQFMGSDHVVFDGFIVTNPTHHTMPSGENTHSRNVKIIGWASNQDGIRPSDNSLGEQLFLKTSDDLDYARNPGQVLRDSVVWPMRNGALGMLGWNNLGQGGTRFENIHVIHSEWDLDAADKRNTGVLGSVLNQGVDQQGNVVENLYGEWGMGMLANISITYDGAKSPNSPDPDIGWGELTGFTFCNILLEAPFQNSGGVPVRNQLRGFSREGARAMLRDFRFVNLVAGNTLVSNDNAGQFFDIDPDTTSNIQFTTEGEIHQVTVTTNGGGRARPSGTVPTPAGMDRYISVIADPGMCIKRVVVDGVDRGRLQNVFFADIDQDHAVEVEFGQGPDTFDGSKVCGENVPAPESTPFELNTGMSAAWFDPSRNGEGFLLEVLEGNVAVLYWFTYDDLAGQEWYIAVGEVRDHAASFDEVLRMSGGVFGPEFDPGKIGFDVAGSARFSWSGCNHGRMTWTIDNQSGSQQLQRLTRLAATDCLGVQATGDPVAALSGSWFDPEHDGEGFVLEILEGGVPLVYWFSYGPEGDLRWFFGVGEQIEGQLVFEDMFTTSGAVFGEDFDPQDVVVASWGSLVLDIDCSGGVARYESTEAGFGNGEQQLIRLTSLLSDRCAGT